MHIISEKSCTMCASQSNKAPRFCRDFPADKEEGHAHLTAVHSPQLAGKFSWQLHVSARQFSCQDPFHKVPSANALPQRAANAHRELLKGQRRKLLDCIIAGHRTSGMLTSLLSSPTTGEMPKSKTFKELKPFNISLHKTADKLAESQAGFQ